MTAKNDERRGERWPFIPAWLDDANLTAPQFRIVCTILRSDVLWRSVPALAARVKLDRKTVQRALRDLIAWKVIEPTRRPGQTTAYTVNPVLHWKIPSDRKANGHPARSTPHPNGTPAPSPFSTPAPSPNDTLHPARSTPHKGISFEGISHEGGNPSPFDFAIWSEAIGREFPGKWAKEQDALTKDLDAFKETAPRGTDSKFMPDAKLYIARIKQRIDHLHALRTGGPRPKQAMAQSFA